MTRPPQGPGDAPNGDAPAPSLTALADARAAWAGSTLQIEESDVADEATVDFDPIGSEAPRSPTAPCPLFELRTFVVPASALGASASADERMAFVSSRLRSHIGDGVVRRADVQPYEPGYVIVRVLVSLP